MNQLRESVRAVVKMLEKLQDHHGVAHRAKELLELELERCCARCGRQHQTIYEVEDYRFLAEVEALVGEMKPEVVWSNECRLVIHREGDEGKPGSISSRRGEMGLDHFVEGHRSARSFRITIESMDPEGKHETFSKLEDVPVRVVVYRVPGGHS